jgi:hypothetical protein
VADLHAIVRDIAARYASAGERGKVASYIPQLAHVDPGRFGITLITADGEEIAGGDADMPFSIQSVSKVFALTLALGRDGEALWRRVGREPSGDPFNSIVQLEHERGVPRNPFINAGAIAVTDVLLSRHSPAEAIGQMLRFLRQVCEDDEIMIDAAVARSETETGFRNVALANFMRAYGNLENRPELTLGVYFHNCAIAMSCRQLARGAVPRMGRKDGAGRGAGDVGADRPADQRADAHLRSLRRLGGIRVPRRPSGQERRRRRHPRGRPGSRLDRVLVAGAERGGQLAAGDPRARRSGAGYRMVGVRRAIGRVRPRAAPRRGARPRAPAPRAAHGR